VLEEVGAGLPGEAVGHGLMVCGDVLMPCSKPVYPGSVIGEVDRPLRLMAFRWLTTLASEHGDLLPRSQLEAGFDAGGTRIRLVGPQGIFKPAAFELPISVTTSPNSPYSDRWDNERRQLLYSFRGLDPLHPDNTGLRRAMLERVPSSTSTASRQAATWRPTQCS
jgi:putative restriction endonuclease